MTLWLLFAWLNLPDAGPALQKCASCHIDEAKQHADSRHSKAWANNLFQHEYAPSPKAWCVSCHAPDVPASSREAPPKSLTAHGVSCASCHLRGGRMHSSRRSPKSIHSTVVEQDFGGQAMCASCHQFNFPVLGDGGTLLHSTNVPMQNTVAEYRKTGSLLSCTDCHMARGHRFLGSHDHQMLAQALRVGTCRESARTLRIDLSNRGAAHNVPSGGVHRHIAVRVWRSNSPARVRTTRLGRTFAVSGKRGKKLATDTTLAPGRARHLSVPVSALGGKSDEPINVRLDYVFQAPNARAGTRAPEPDLHFWQDRVVLSQLPRCESR